QWFGSKRLYPVPIVNRNFSDSLDYAGNIYTKAGWVLKMLHEQLGDQDFFLGLHHYLEVNRGENVVTADLQKAIEQATSRNVDEFVYQWLYRAGAPEFEVHYTYDDAAHQVKLSVQQTQKVEGLVGLFHVPVEIEIATASGNKTYPIDVSKASETFTIPADAAPRMVIFDKGDAILKSVNFEKDPAAWMYQLKNAETVPDRAEAAAALGGVKDNNEAIAALGEAALHDPFWGVRNESLRALGKIGGAAAENQILAGVSNEASWVRQVAVTQLGHFKDDAALGPKLTDIAANDKAWTVRGAALDSLAEIKAPNAFDTLTAAAKMESPDDMIRNAALRGLGALGDDRGVPLVLEWSAIGKPFESRRAAISALANLDKSNTDITKTLISYLREPYFDIQYSTLSALGRRGDVTAIAPLEALVQSGDLSLGTGPFVQREIDALKAKAAGKKSDGAAGADAGVAAGAMNDQVAILQQMQKIERQMEELNQRVAGIESQLAAPKK
ncbi:MAG: HEAT repeat domain-containing protein, partial [Candidatus Acidiferrales bacterium]